MTSKTCQGLAFVMFLLLAGGASALAWRPQFPARPKSDSGWVPQSSGVLAHLTGVYFFDQDRGWVIGQNGMLLTTEDGGRNWARKPLPAAMRQPRLRDLWVLEKTRLLLLAEGGPGTSPFRGQRSFLAAHDMRSSEWQFHQFERNQPAEEDERATVQAQEPLLQSLFFLDAHKGWACGETGAIQVTADGGQTWARQASKTQKLLNAIAAIDERQVWIVGAGGTVLRTVDGGEQWREHPLPVKSTWRAIGFLDQRRGWIAGGGLLCRTQDGGQRWELISSDLPRDLNDLIFLDDREGWAAGSRGTLLHTVDGGLTWESVPLRTHANLNRLFFVSAQRGWVVGSNGVILHYHRDNL